MLSGIRIVVQTCILAGLLCMLAVIMVSDWIMKDAGE